MAAGKIPIEERFWKRADMKPFGCWETSYTPSQTYGAVKLNGRDIKAHRLAYELAYGEIPEGLIVLHSCDNPRCVRPDHLEVGTHQDNSRDMSSKKRGRGQRKTHCIRSHSRWGQRSGRRYCMDCDNEASKKRYERTIQHA